MVLDDEGRRVRDPGTRKGLPIVESIGNESRVEEHGDRLRRILISLVPTQQARGEPTQAEA